MLMFKTVMHAGTVKMHG